MADSGSPSVSTVRTDRQLRSTAAQLGGVVNGRAVDQRGGRCHHAVATGLDNAVVLPFTEAEVVGIDDQYAFHLLLPLRF